MSRHAGRTSSQSYSQSKALQLAVLTHQNKPLLRDIKHFECITLSKPR